MVVLAGVYSDQPHPITGSLLATDTPSGKGVREVLRATLVSDVKHQVTRLDAIAFTFLPPSLYPLTPDGISLHYPLHLGGRHHLEGSSYTSSPTALRLLPARRTLRPRKRPRPKPSSSPRHSPNLTKPCRLSLPRMLRPLPQLLRPRPRSE